MRLGRVSSHSTYELIDAFAPLNLPMSEPEVLEARGLRIRARHAMILANARRLIARQDFHALSVKELSSICGVSPQSLHVKIGSKLTIISAAGKDLSTAFTARASQETDPYHRILHYTELLYESCRTKPQFHLAWSNSAFNDASGEMVHRDARRPVIDFVRSTFNYLHSKSLWDGGIDTRVASDCIVNLLSAAVHDWACGDLPIGELRENLLQRVITILKGSAAKPAVEQVWKSIATYVPIGAGGCATIPGPACAPN